MAKSAVAYTFCVMVMFALAANAHPGVYAVALHAEPFETLSQQHT